MNKQFLESMANAEWAGHLCKVPWEPRAGDLAVWLWVSHMPSLALIFYAREFCSACKCLAQSYYVISSHCLSLSGVGVLKLSNTFIHTCLTHSSTGGLAFCIGTEPSLIFLIFVRWETPKVMPQGYQ